MRRLRQKLEDRPEQPAFLVTVAGFGYRLNEKGLSLDSDPAPTYAPTEL